MELYPALAELGRGTRLGRAPGTRLRMIRVRGWCRAFPPMRGETAHEWGTRLCGGMEGHSTIPKLLLVAFAVGDSNSPCGWEGTLSDEQEDSRCRPGFRALRCPCSMCNSIPTRACIQRAASSRG